MTNKYWDCAATTKPDESVIKMFYDYSLNNYYNPSAYYSNISADIEDATSRGLCKLFNCNTNEIIYTSGGTESNNTIINSFYFTTRIISNTEHHSINTPWKVPVDNKGIVRLDVLKKWLKYAHKPFVSINYVNNETGVVQPINKIAEIVHSYGGLLHSDMTQAIGHLPIKDLQTDVDFTTFSGHKFHAPKGIGGLYVKEKYKSLIEPLLIGGKQQEGKRAGTENTAGIMAINKAAEMIDDIHINRMKLIKAAILSGIDFEYKVNGDIENTSCNILNIQVIGLNGKDIQSALALKGFCIGVGSACNNYSNKPSDVLLAMGLSEKEATSSIRLSWDKNTDLTDAEMLIEELNNTVKTLKEIRL